MVGNLLPALIQGRIHVRTILSLAFLPIALVACGPSEQADSGDVRSESNNMMTGAVPDGVPTQGPGTALTDGETSTRGAVSAADAPTSSRGKTMSNDGSAIDSGGQ